MFADPLPLVSIAIPLYNHSRYVEKCLESIAADPYPYKEVLVLDDGSTDASFYVVQKWYSERKNLFPNFILSRQKNQGIANTLNQLVQIANGEYIALLASDDYLIPGGIEARVNHLKRNPNLLAVFGDCMVVDEHDEILCKSGISNFYPSAARIEALKNEKLLALELILRWTVPGPVFLMRKSACDVIGYYDESLTVEDRDFYLRLLTHGALGFVDYKVSCYRWHKRNSTRNPVGRDKHHNSLKLAALKSSRNASGIFRLALIVDAKRFDNPGWREAMRKNGISGFINSISITTIWNILHRYQNTRVWISRHFPPGQ